MVKNETFDNSANTAKQNLTLGANGTKIASNSSEEIENPVQEQASNFLDTTETWTTDGMDELNDQNDMGM